MKIYIKQIRFLVLFIFIISSNFLFAQNKTSVLFGYTLEETSRKKIDGVVCQGFNSSDDLLVYSISNSKGYFELEENTDVSYITLSLLGYNSKTIRIKNFKNGAEYFLEPSDYNLKEVVVAIKPIEKIQDTINYNASSFMGKEDQYISDLLKKMPGIKVAENGNISYQGQSISNFYIEGQDLLGNQYNQATNNISADAVFQVQVIQNNQHIRALKNAEISDKVALNIKLKADKKQKPFGEILAGSGYEDELLYTGKIFGVHISKKSQSLIDFKINNNGNDVTKELQEHVIILNNFFYDKDPENMIDKSLMSSVPFKSNRYLFNKSHIASFNNLTKLNDKSLSLKTNLSLSSSRKDQEVNKLYNYGNENGILTINEKSNQRNKYDNYRINLTLENNTEKMYFKDEVKLTRLSESGYNKILSNNKNLSSDTDLKPKTLQNNLSLVLKDNKRVYKIQSLVKYLNRNEDLTNNRNENNVIDELEQYNKGEFFTAKNQIATLFSFQNRSTLDLSFNIDYLSHKYKTQIDKIPTDININEIANNNTNNEVKLYITPNYTYKYNNSDLIISVPINYIRKTSENFKFKELNHNSFYVSPRVTNRLSLNHKVDLISYISYDKTYGDNISLLKNQYFKNYRTIYLPSDILSTNHNYTLGTGFNYQNLSELLFMNFFVSYMVTKKNTMSFNTYEINYNFMEEVLKNNHMRFMMLNYRIDKTFVSKNLNTSLEARYVRAKSSFLQSTFQVDNVSHNINLNLAASIQLTNKFTINYSCDGDIKWEDNDINNSDKLKSLYQKINLFYFPINKLKVSLTNEYYMSEISKDEYKNWLFTDFETALTLKKLELGLTVNNIWNKTYYELTYNSGINSTTQNIPLRGREVMGTIKLKF